MAVLGLNVLNAGGRYLHPATFLVLVQLVDLSPYYVTDTPFGPSQPIGSPATVNVSLFSPSGQAYRGASMTADPNTIGNFYYYFVTQSTDEQGEYTASFNAVGPNQELGTFPARPFAIFGNF